MSPPRDETRRGRVRAAFLAFVAFQLVVPISYYLRSDPYDERFAWRMFSDVRMHHCETRVREKRGAIESTLNLPHEIHVAWIEHLARNRRSVIDRFLVSRCDLPGVTSVELTNECTSTSQRRLPVQRYTRECASGRVSSPASGLDSRGSR